MNLNTFSLIWTLSRQLRLPSNVHKQNVNNYFGFWYIEKRAKSETRWGGVYKCDVSWGYTKMCAIWWRSDITARFRKIPWIKADLRESSRGIGGEGCDFIDLEVPNWSAVRVGAKFFHWESGLGPVDFYFFAAGQFGYAWLLFFLLRVISGPFDFYFLLMVWLTSNFLLRVGLTSTFKLCVGFGSYWTI